MTDREAIETRIQQFIQDHADWERTCAIQSNSLGDVSCPGELMENPEAIDAFLQSAAADSVEGNSSVARRALELISRKHCTPDDLLTRAGFHFSNRLQHDPEIEQVVEVTIRGSEAVVATQSPAGMPAAFEYRLIKVARVWRIAGIDAFHSDDTPPPTPDWPASHFRQTFRACVDAGIDFDAAFKPGAKTHNCESGKSETITVVDLGSVDAPSGLLIAYDPAYGPADAVPLEVRLTRTQLPVQVARSGFYNAFVRVWLAPKVPIIAFVPARHASADDPEQTAQAEAGTRCGAIIIADAAAWHALTPREGERFALHMHDGIENPAREPARLVAIPRKSALRAALVNRGGGDFSCPCYWGLDAKGTPVVLIIDLQVAGDHVAEEFVLPWSERLVDRAGPIPQLTEFGFDVCLSRVSEQELRVTSQAETLSVDLVNKKGGLIASTDQGELMSTGGQSTQYLRFTQPMSEGQKLRFRWRRWHHGFARPSAFDS